MSPVTIDLEKYPDLYFRLDNFTIPETARQNFEAALRRNMAFIKGLPGFLGHVVFEKVGGPSTFNIATIAVWENKASVSAAREKVKAYYEEIGFDVVSSLKSWGATAEIGDYQAPMQLQGE